MPEDILSYIWEQLHTNQLDNVSVCHYSHKKILNWSQKKNQKNPKPTPSKLSRWQWNKSSLTEVLKSWPFSWPLLSTLPLADAHNLPSLLSWTRRLTAKRRGVGMYGHVTVLQKIICFWIAQPSFCLYMKNFAEDFTHHLWKPAFDFETKRSSVYSAPLTRWLWGFWSLWLLPVL